MGKIGRVDKLEVLDKGLDDEEVQQEKGFSLQGAEEWVFLNRQLVLVCLTGLVLLGAGLFFFRSNLFEGTKIEVLGSSSAQNSSNGADKAPLTVEVAGYVVHPGVYSLNSGDRVEQLLIAAGGLSAGADREWAARSLNRAAKLADGQKIYIPKVGEAVTESSKGSKSSISSTGGGVVGLINLNTASLKELDTLPGIGATRAQGIISGRPYSTIDELLTKKVLPKSVFEKIKDKIQI